MSVSKTAKSLSQLPPEMRPVPVLGRPAKSDVALEILGDLSELQFTPGSLEDRISPLSSPETTPRTGRQPDLYIIPEDDEPTFGSPTTPPSKKTPTSFKSRLWSDSSPDVSSTETTPEKKAPSTPHRSRLWATSSSGGSSVESSPAKSAPQTPKNAGIVVDITTPSPLKDAKEIIRESDTSCELLRSDQQTLERGFECLAGLDSHNRNKQIVSMHRIFVDVLNTSGSSALEVPCRSARRTLFAINNSKMVADWVKEALGRAEVVTIDRDHHTKFEKGSGKHILMDNDPLDPSIINRLIHRTTGIWCGCITSKNDLEGKFSSFIPRLMPELTYYSLVSEAIEDKSKTIARGESKGLFLINDGNHNLCIQVYFEPKGNGIRSAFPIFHYADFDTKTESLIIPVEFQPTAADPCSTMLFERPYPYLLEIAKKLKQGDEAIQYETPEALIVDIALLIGERDKFGFCPFERGIFIKFPKSLL